MGNGHRNRGVYFLTAKTVGLTKIGFSTDCPSRLEAIKLSCPDGDLSAFVIPQLVPAKLEGYLHHRFRRWRRHGEWFDLPDSFIRRVRRDYSDRLFDYEFASPVKRTVGVKWEPSSGEVLEWVSLCDRVMSGLCDYLKTRGVDRALAKRAMSDWETSRAIERWAELVMASGKRGEKHG
jgi:hypothetical protein